jgi:hypothetical protein
MTCGPGSAMRMQCFCFGSESELECSTSVVARQWQRENFQLSNLAFTWFRAGHMCRETWGLELMCRDLRIGSSIMLIAASTSQMALMEAERQGLHAPTFPELESWEEDPLSEESPLR